MKYRVRFHPAVRKDLETIARLIAEHSGREAAEARLAEIEAAVRRLEETPHKGTLRHEIAAGLRAIPAGRRAVVAFVVDDAAEEVRVYAVSYGGADWISRVRTREQVGRTRRQR